MTEARYAVPWAGCDEQAIADLANDCTAFLRLAETLTAFSYSPGQCDGTSGVIEHEKIVGLLVTRHRILLPAAD